MTGKKKKILLFIIYYCAVLLGVAADQLTKRLATGALSDGRELRVLPYLFNLTYVENRGAAWGLLADHRWVFMIISTAAVVLLSVALFVFADRQRLFCIPLCLIICGGVGNMVDRVALGYVVDFIQFDFWRSFPVFNLADSFITVGAVMMLIFIIFFDKTVFADGKKTHAPEKSDSDEAAG